MTGALLSVRGLSKSFGGRVAVEDVSFELQGGVATALVGPNGAGKTTLFNLITGNIALDRGDVQLRGRSITRMPPHRVAKLGVARSFQDLRLFSHVSVVDNVRIATESATWFWQPGGRAAAAERSRLVWDALDQVGLYKLAEVRAVDLSYAEAKFLSLARIIASGARIWLLDEPASGLDPASRDHFVAVLRRAVQQGTTICLIEHNLDIVTALADRIVFLDQGRKLAEDRPEATLRDPELISIYFGERR